jgi:Flp pilus assembly protein TadG
LPKEADVTKRAIVRQQGAILILVAITLAVLLGFAGLVIYLGGLYVARTELQSAVDSCALAAAQELNGLSDSTLRATNAGLTAGNLNKVRYQKVSAGLVGSDITFSDSLAGSYSTGFDPTKAKYAQCTRQITGITAYLIELVGGSKTNSVAALAKATLGPSQGSCPLPLGLLPKSGGTSSNDYGYTIGEWVPMYNGQNPSPGEVGWFNLDGSKSANETADELMYGYCNSRIGDQVGTQGVEANTFNVWNARFGIYTNAAVNGSNPVWPPPPIVYGTQPDQTGYGYTATNWPDRFNAYNGTLTTTGSDPNVHNYKDNTQTYFENYDKTGSSVSDGDTITGLNLKGAYKVLATAGNGGQHQLYGTNKRLIAVPVLSQSGSNYTIQDYACMLLLTPMSCNSSTLNCDPIYVEYEGLANLAGGPCAGNGAPGNGKGPLVPVLVQ